MITINILAHLLDYPSEELWCAREELLSAIAQDSMSPTIKETLSQFVTTYLSQSLLEAQAHYYETFDTSRLTSLLLFEHVHGDSRDRGQAMVDLLARYADAGFAVTQNQLPDYLPLLLEFLSTCSHDEITQWLNELEPILMLLKVRLEKRESVYSSLFDVLLSFTTTRATDVDNLILQISQEQNDTTPENLDAVWQEEQILFQQNAACDSMQEQRHAQVKQQVPTYFIDMAETKRSPL